MPNIIQISLRSLNEVIIQISHEIFMLYIRNSNYIRNLCHKIEKPCKFKIYRASK